MVLPAWLFAEAKMYFYYIIYTQVDYKLRLLLIMIDLYWDIFHNWAFKCIIDIYKVYVENFIWLLILKRTH